MRYPYEDEIEKVVHTHFGGCWTFDSARKLPNEDASKGLTAIRQLVYTAMTKSFNDGIEFQKSGKKGQQTNDTNFK